MYGLLIFSRLLWLDLFNSLRLIASQDCCAILVWYWIWWVTWQHDSIL